MGPNGPHCNSKFLGEKFSRVSQKQNKNKTKQNRTEQNKRGSSPAGEEGGGAGVEEPEGPGEGEVDRGGLARSPGGAADPRLGKPGGAVVGICSEGGGATGVIHMA